MSFVIATTSRRRGRHGETLYMVDRAKQRRSFWSSRTVDAFVFADRAAALRKAASYRFNSPKAIIHHVDQNRTNNIPTNLVICPDRAYHLLIHQRLRALAACGNPNWRKCPYCKEYGDPSLMRKSSSTYRHLECSRALGRKRYQARKEQHA